MDFELRSTLPLLTTPQHCALRDMAFSSFLMLPYCVYCPSWFFPNPTVLIQDRGFVPPLPSCFCFVDLPHGLDACSLTQLRFPLLWHRLFLVSFASRTFLFPLFRVFAAPDHVPASAVVSKTLTRFPLAKAVPAVRLGRFAGPPFFPCI